MIVDKEFNLKRNQSFINWEQNIIIILGLIRILNIKIKNIMPLIMKLSPIEGRGRNFRINYENKSFTLIDESYNSNPESLSKAIENLENFKFKNSRIICVIGDMLELGKISKSCHLKIVKTLLKTKPDIIFTVGEYSNFIYEKLPEYFLKFHFNNYKNVFDKLLSIIKNNDIIMIKGSNSTNLHLVSKKLIELG
jgi:murE/murF fusion protein